MEREPLYRYDDLHWRITPEILPKDVTAGMTSRSGGVSRPPYESLNTAFHVGDDPQNVLENRRRTAEASGFAMKDWVAAEQVHKADILKVEDSHRGMGAWNRENAAGNYDGLYTRSKGLLLVSFYADCVPLLFFAPGHGCIGSAHAGWRGTSLDIGGKLVAAWVEEEHIPPQDIYAVIGPAVSEPVYEVDDRVIEMMQEVLPPGETGPWNPSAAGRYLLNIREMNRLLLKQAGVRPEHIFVSSRCTYLEEDDFFSHRRDGSASGRMAAFIGQSLLSDNIEEDSGKENLDSWM
ncbi:peptidoglycan editing factor PgeF [Salibacterium sp. K-3]